MGNWLPLTLFLAALRFVPLCVCVCLANKTTEKQAFFETCCEALFEPMNVSAANMF